MILRWKKWLNEVAEAQVAVTDARRHMARQAAWIREQRDTIEQLRAANAELIESGREAIEAGKDAIRDRDLCLEANISMARRFEEVLEAKTLHEAKAIARIVLSGVGL